MSIKSILCDHNSICFYPSAGSDFRPTLFLSENYCRWKGITTAGKEFPDLFVFVDSNPSDEWLRDSDEGEEETKGILLWEDYWNRREENTYVQQLFSEDYLSVKHLVAPRLRSCKGGGRTLISIIGIPERIAGADGIGPAYYMHALIHSYKQDWEDYYTDILYVEADNWEFASHYLAGDEVNVDYIIRMRFGDEMGDATVSGNWLLGLANVLKTKYLLSPKINRNDLQEVPDELIQAFPNNVTDLEQAKEIELGIIYEIPKKEWNNRYDVLWYELK